MKRVRLLSPFLNLGCASVLVLCALAQMPAVDDKPQYIYADLGCLAQVIDEQGKVALITCRSFWQAVGNFNMAELRWLALQR